MTRTLILTRHAKSSWGDPFQGDHERPLNKRGRRSAPVVATWLRQSGWLPDEVFSSSAARTRETWERMGLQAEAHFTRALYLADPEAMRQVLSKARGQTVLMLSHNPGIAEFAHMLLQHPPDHDRFHDYPTCATTVIRFNIENWADIQWHSGTVLGFVIPRELPE